jgi:hypothetical protein
MDLLPDGGCTPRTRRISSGTPLAAADRVSAGA